MPFANTNDGQEIYYEQQGSTGPVLVFVSGYMGITKIWQPLIDKFKPNYTCFAYDNRGYGHSSKPESADDYSIPRHAEDLAAVLGCLDLKAPVVLIAHSMGGNIASAYYLANPTRVSGIVSSGTFFDGKTFQAAGVTPEDITPNVDKPSQCVEFYANMGLDRTLALHAAQWPAYARKHNAQALFAFEMGNDYTKITVPYLIIQGAEDKITPVDSCVRPIIEAMPFCELKVVKGANHFPITEAVDEVGDLIEAFVKSGEIGSH
ncbi:alpha/beta fold family hydrolase [Penicillium sp. IBT 31633x]|nr:alpha/beta fold family hydrolase [Penicillium sp. IBT 31633x]